MSFNLQTLTEGIRQRHVGAQNKRLVEKWNRTGLLRGLDDIARENMSTLLENQAAQVLREANTLGSDGGGQDIRGFTNIAFPIVRRVFGGLVANELVSIQPMSLPSGLLFYLDYTYGSDVGGGVGELDPTYEAGQSIYNSPVGKGVQSGSLGTGGQYDLAGSGFSRVHDAVEAGAGAAPAVAGSSNRIALRTNLLEILDASQRAFDETSAAHKALVDYDSQVIDLAAAGTMDFFFLAVKLSELSDVDRSAVKDIAIRAVKDNTPADLSQAVGDTVQGGKAHNVRRLNKLGTVAAGVFSESAPEAATHALLLVRLAAGKSAPDAVAAQANDISTALVTHVKADSFSASSSGGDALTVPAFESNMGLGSAQAPVIPEIDIKIESIPVTAQTRKLRARWSPELAQDLNAYHSMDAEVELTQILSEQIALEIDREILNDLLTQARGANYYWSRSPGKFVNKATGAEIARTSTLTPGPAFTGTVREWYETLTETVIDVANEIHRKTLRGSANFIVVSPDVATILEASVLYRPAYSLDGDGQVGAPFTMGAEKIGTLSNRFTVYKDPYFPRNKILVGYKGGSYLETGFVYAPYVPLIVTPTIFAPEDFTPRKGVMTRYGKKMVRADFYGTVTCLDMNVI